MGKRKAGGFYLLKWFFFVFLVGLEVFVVGFGWFIDSGAFLVVYIRVVLYFATLNLGCYLACFSLFYICLVSCSRTSIPAFAYLDERAKPFNGSFRKFGFHP